MSGNLGGLNQEARKNELETSWYLSAVVACIRSSQIDIDPAFLLS